MPIQALLRKSANIDDLEIIIELLDKPALIYTQDKGRIEACNSAFIRFTGYSKKNIVERWISELFPDLSLVSPINQDGGYNLKLANGSIIEVKADHQQLQSENKLSVIRIDAKKPDEVELPENIKNNWEAIDQLLTAPLAGNLRTALNDTFIAGKTLTDCDHLAIYLPIPGSEKKLIIIDNLGDIDYLPKVIHITEIKHLNIPVIWQLGAHTSSVLHQSALAAQQTYVATCPLNPDSTEKGLLVLGNKTTGPPKHLMPMLKIISRTASVCLNIHKVVTESKIELEQINYQLEIVRNIRNQISEGIIFTDTDYSIIDLNTSASQILGYSGAEMLGQPLEKILICEQGLPDILREMGKSQELVHDLGELEVNRRDGRTIPILIRAIPLISDKGPNALAILFTDLSTLKQYEDRSRQLETQANIGEMIAVFAHEVRNPINNIRMGVENFSAFLSDDSEAAPEIDRILGDVDRLSDLMKSILTAYRTKEYLMEPIHLPVLIESILFRWKSRMSRYNVNSSVEVNNNDKVILGDKRALEQVFTNIIQNAIDAMRETGGKLVVRISDETEYDGIRVDIADTGPGIPAEIQDKIFNLYYTTRQNGNGIGLAITKQIVDAHSGQITVTSVPGGTVFRIILPRGKK